MFTQNKHVTRDRITLQWLLHKEGIGPWRRRPARFQNQFFCVLYTIKRILSLRVILPTQCFVSFCEFGYESSESV